MAFGSITRGLGFEVISSRTRQQLDSYAALPHLESTCFLLSALSSSRVTVLQIGAHDGSTDDRLGRVISTGKVESLLVEPCPDMFSQLESVYSSQEHVRLFNGAISYDGERTLHQFEAVTERGRNLRVYSSFDIKYLRAVKSSKGIESGIRQVNVTCETVKGLMAKTSITGVDVMVIDTEGYDAKIVNGVFSEDIFPIAIQYERVNLERKEREALESALSRHGYAYFDIERDTFAFRKQSLLSLVLGDGTITDE